jgi:hypothetical protein
MNPTCGQDEKIKNEYRNLTMTFFGKHSFARLKSKHIDHGNPFRYRAFGRNLPFLSNNVFLIFVLPSDYSVNIVFRLLSLSPISHSPIILVSSSCYDNSVSSSLLFSC